MKTEEFEKPAYFGILEAEIRYDKRICAAAKVLYAELTALTKSKGYAFASNAYLARLYDVTPGTISDWVSQLEKAGHIRVEVDKEAGNSRKIWLSVATRGRKGTRSNPDTLSEKPDTSTDKSYDPSTEKPTDPYSEKAEHNNTSNNNTRMNSKSEGEAAHPKPITPTITNQPATDYKVPSGLENTEFREVFDNFIRRTRRSGYQAELELKRLRQYALPDAIDIVRAAESGGFRNLVYDGRKPSPPKVLPNQGMSNVERYLREQMAKEKQGEKRIDTRG